MSRNCGVSGAINLRDYGLLVSLRRSSWGSSRSQTGRRTDGAANITNLVLQNSYIVVMALGMLLVIVAGHIDLSVGSIVGFIGAVAAMLIVVPENPLPPRLSFYP